MTIERGTATPDAAAGDARAGIRTALPAALGLVPMGFAFGVLVTQYGLDWWWATAFAAIIFAGSLEFLLIGMVMAAAPLSQIAVTAFLVNFRHVFFALSFPLHRVHGAAPKASSTFLLTEAAWALTSSEEAASWSRRRILALQATLYAGWVACVTVGALLGRLVPEQVVGLDFAVTAFFVVLALEAYRVRRSIPLPLVGAACALGAQVLVGEQMLLVAMGAYLAFLIVRFPFVVRRSRRDA